jgi:hypothetical protein
MSARKATATFRLSSQEGGFGKFGEIDVEVREHPQAKFDFDCAPDVGKYEWQYAFLDGIKWAREFVPESRRFDVKVARLRSMPCDTTEQVVSYILACAICKALDVPHSIVFDPTRVIA